MIYACSRKGIPLWRNFSVSHQNINLLRPDLHFHNCLVLATLVMIALLTINFHCVTSFHSFLIRLNQSGLSSQFCIKLIWQPASFWMSSSPPITFCPFRHCTLFSWLSIPPKTSMAVFAFGSLSSKLHLSLEFVAGSVAQAQLLLIIMWNTFLISGPASWQSPIRLRRQCCLWTRGGCLPSCSGAFMPFTRLHASCYQHQFSWIRVMSATKIIVFLILFSLYKVWRPNNYPWL